MSANEGTRVPERILVCVAWPYANGPIHQGQFAGAYLPPDIFARYHRLQGNQVLMVSGSDQHGTPITVRAEQEGVSPDAIVGRYHPSFLETWRRMAVSFDLFTTTGTENHAAVVQDMFLRLHERGHIYPDTMTLPYCPVEERFLLDRYVEGTCPYCAYAGARGDQCDNCGRTLEPLELVDPRCRFCGATPVARESEHFFLRLSAFQEPLVRWVETQAHWRTHVRNFTLGFLKEGLRDRAITRDLTWGVRIPLPGYESKRIYVWFEAVIGYLSASKEWAQRRGDPEAWRPFWEDPGTRSYYFIGKDNIPFHTIIWPAMLLGYDGLNLPYDVPANQYVTIRGSKASTSRNLAVWLPDYLERYDPDPLRYYLAATMPETSDSDFSWDGFVHRNNDELVATWGNLVQRVLTLVHRSFGGRVPELNESSAPGGRAAELLRRCDRVFDEVGDEIAACHFRAGLGAAMALAQEANAYLSETEPWKLVTSDPPAAARVLAVCLQVVAALRTALYPYLPFTCERLHEMLQDSRPLPELGWAHRPLAPGHALGQPRPLFRKLPPEVVTEEEARLGL